MDAGYEDVVVLEKIVKLLIGVENAVGVELEEMALRSCVRGP